MKFICPRATMRMGKPFSRSLVLILLFLFPSLGRTLAQTIPAEMTVTNVDPRIAIYTFPSAVLEKKMAFTVVYPKDYAATGAPWPVLFFLHGLGRNEHTLVDDLASRQKLLEQPYVIVLPKGENGWYFDSPFNPKRHYAAYLDEVMGQAARVANISAARPDRAIGGWSAGGFGSVWACVHHPESFSTLATIIGVVDFPAPDTRFPVPDATFGKDPTRWPEFDPLNRAAELKNLNILLVIGEQSSDAVMNERLSQALTAAGLAHDVVRVQGGHTFPTVQAGLGPVLDFVQKHLPPRSLAKQ